MIIRDLRKRDMNDLIARLHNKEAIRGTVCVNIGIAFQQTAARLFAQKRCRFLTRIRELRHTATSQVYRIY
ncbi:hypothetical protein D3C85_1560970 [compost metagenome]